MVLLKADNLSIHRGSCLLLDGFACTVVGGQALWLTGPNGIGKSTLLQVLAGVRLPLRGAVEQISAFIYQPSATGFDPALTVAQNLDWWSRAHAADGMPLAAALQGWGLSAQSRTIYANLSQGQRQRAALARLSLSTAPLWLLDEPLAHLDAAGIALFTAAASAHLQRGGAMIAATHAIPDLAGAQVAELVAA